MSNGTPDPKVAQSTVIESQVDWLTCGWSEGRAADRVEAWAFSRAQREAREGFHSAPFRLLGFEGYATGRIRFGRRNGDALLQLSGQLADDALDTVAPLAERISRVDIAVTVRLPTADTLVAEQHYAEACTWRDEHPTSALPKLVTDGDGGATCYVGRRTSDRLLRVYNKQAEQLAGSDVDGSTHYQNCWRYELECKGTAAAPLAAALVCAPNRPDYVQQSVHDYCELHGLGPIFPSRGERVLLPGFRRRSDTQSRLAWFRGAVAPAILKMAGEVERAEILDALGLGEEREGD